MRYGLEMVGPDQLMFASDHPWGGADVISSIVDDLPVSDAERAKITGGMRCGCLGWTCRATSSGH